MEDRMELTAEAIGRVMSNHIKMQRGIASALRVDYLGKPEFGAEVYIPSQKTTVVMNRAATFEFRLPKACLGILQKNPGSVLGISSTCNSMSARADRYLSEVLEWGIQEGNYLHVNRMSSLNVDVILTELNDKLTREKTSLNERWLVVPPWLAELIRIKSSYNKNCFSGFEMFESEQLSNVFYGSKYSEAARRYNGEWKIVAGGKNAILFVDSICKLKTVFEDDTQSYLTRGIYIFGSSFQNANQIAVAYQNVGM